MAIYRAADGAHYGNKMAQVLGETLESLGNFTPRDVVQAARRKDSPIHSLFEWDNREAADKYRLDQARRHVNHLRVVIEPSSGAHTKAFHSIAIQRESQPPAFGYVSMRTVHGDDAMREQVVAKARAELRGWRERYEEYRDVFGVVLNAIDEIDQEAAVA